MASVKEYAYYMEGSKVSLIEKEAAFDNDANSRDYGPGTDRFQWKSPLSDVTSGLEILYTYSPTYKTYASPIVNVNKFYINGWTVIGGYLTFLRNDVNAATNATDWTTAPENAVTSGTQGDTGGQSLDYIVVEGSSRWNGLHRIQTAGSDGTLKTYTKVNSSLPYWEDKDIDFTSSEVMKDGDGSSNLHLADHFSAGDYVFISGVSSTLQNNGFFKVASVAQSTVDTSSTVTVDKEYGVILSDNNATLTGLDNEYIVDASWGNQVGLDTVNIYKAHRDFSYILTDVDVLNDEADEIDLPNYLSKATVDYVKAKYLEDQGQFKEAEYFMAKFRKQVEKYNNRIVSGPRMIASGPYGIR